MLLSYRVVAATSEDPGHPARELQNFHSHSRGWQSSHFSESPQKLVLRFSSRVTLQQVQLLSHQFKIAQRVELFIGAPADGAPLPASGDVGIHYHKLGHFSLNSNERSSYQARELKTVYVPEASEGEFLKLLLHKSHVHGGVVKQ